MYLIASWMLSMHDLVSLESPKYIQKAIADKMVDILKCRNEGGSMLNWI